MYQTINDYLRSLDSGSQEKTRLKGFYDQIKKDLAAYPVKEFDPAVWKISQDEICHADMDGKRALLICKDGFIRRARHILTLNDSSEDIDFVISELYSGGIIACMASKVCFYQTLPTVYSSSYWQKELDKLPKNYKEKILEVPTARFLYPLILKKFGFYTDDKFNVVYNKDITLSRNLVERNNYIAQDAYRQLYQYVSEYLVDEEDKFLTAQDQYFLNFQYNIFGSVALPLTSNTMLYYIDKYLKNDFKVEMKEVRPVIDGQEMPYTQKRYFFKSLED